MSEDSQETPPVMVRVQDGNVIPLDCPTLLQIGNSGCKYARMGVVRP
jgi:hypothetical protein